MSGFLERRSFVSLTAESYRFGNSEISFHQSVQSGCLHLANRDGIPATWAVYAGLTEWVPLDCCVSSMLFFETWFWLKSANSKITHPGSIHFSWNWAQLFHLLDWFIIQSYVKEEENTDLNVNWLQLQVQGERKGIIDNIHLWGCVGKFIWGCDVRNLYPVRLLWTNAKGPNISSE